MSGVERCPAWEDGEHEYYVSPNISPTAKQCACGRIVRQVSAGCGYSEHWYERPVGGAE